MSNKDLHRKLCEIGAKWVKRSMSAGGHACHIALIEPACYGENCDVIGYRHGSKDIENYGDYQDHEWICDFDVGTVLLEAKTSRADFLNDATKPHRIHPETGVGKWRYYICPEGVINIEDLPPKWGLIWVNNRGGVKVIHGAAIKKGSGIRPQRLFGHFAFVEWQRNTQREISILIMALNRIKDAEGLIYAQRKIYSLQMKVDELSRKLQEHKLDPLESTTNTLRQIEIEQGKQQ